MADRPPLPMRPDGLLGRPFAWLMERMNRQAYQATLKILRPKRGDALLEIGFGTGAFLELAIREIGEGTVCGVDPSPLMVAMASNRLKAFEQRIQLDIREGDDRALGWSDESFDRIVALHSFQFWSDPRVSISKTYDLLKPGGMLCLALRHHGKRAPDWLPNPLSRSGAELPSTLKLLNEVGFARVEHVDALSGTNIVRAVKPVAGHSDQP